MVATGSITIRVLVTFSDCERIERIKTIARKDVRCFPYGVIIEMRIKK